MARWILFIVLLVLIAFTIGCYGQTDYSAYNNPNPQYVGGGCGVAMPNGNAMDASEAVASADSLEA